MKIKVFTVYDAKLETYMHPFFKQTKGQAIRDFSDTVSDPKSPFNRHAEDYTLFLIAEYDDETGRFENMKTPESLGLALEMKVPQHNQISADPREAFGGMEQR